MTKIDWTDYQTIFLDMDGTVLDLAYDNHFWRELVPRSLSVSRAEPIERTRSELFARYASKQGQLEWYCLDFWSAELGLNLRELKSVSAHRIRYLPGARDFLRALRQSKRRVVLVTNAHAYTLSLKRAVAGLDTYFECFVSAHELGLAKEQSGFWPRLQERLDFDSESTLFIDDSLAVLDTAADFGVAATLAVTRPDTRDDARTAGRHNGIESLADLLAV